jgi:hypothetical protein
MDEFGDHARVADRFTFLFDVQSREELIIDEAIVLAAFDGFANRVVVEAFSFETLPELRLGETLPR